ncbi:hypothetical protein GBF38_014674 [Nibea albiflora]|uniref:Uncharacterized protein n=1 Tax=Nibea albiflora TaxID=240163 RepID=A0ACB7F5C5_NIBAL|nr:hypothetical protein GBF38_014674 [Nibea albiflora]
MQTDGAILSWLLCTVTLLPPSAGSSHLMHQIRLLTPHTSPCLLSLHREKPATLPGNPLREAAEERDGGPGSVCLRAGEDLTQRRFNKQTAPATSPQGSQRVCGAARAPGLTVLHGLSSCRVLGFCLLLLALQTFQNRQF